MKYVLPRFAPYTVCFLRVIVTDIQSIIIDKWRHIDYDLLLCLYRLSSWLTKIAVFTCYEDHDQRDFITNLCRSCLVSCFFRFNENCSVSATFSKKSLNRNFVRIRQLGVGGRNAHSHKDGRRA